VTAFAPKRSHRAILVRQTSELRLCRPPRTRPRGDLHVWKRPLDAIEEPDELSGPVNFDARLILPNANRILGHQVV
jgi:hypothetical protein